MIEFLSYEQTVALITMLVSPLYVMCGYIIRTNIKMGCDVTALKTANNIYHKTNEDIDKND